MNKCQKPSKVSCFHCVYVSLVTGSLAIVFAWLLIQYGASSCKKGYSTRGSPIASETYLNLLGTSTLKDSSNFQKGNATIRQESHKTDAIKPSLIDELLTKNNEFKWSVLSKDNNSTYVTTCIDPSCDLKCPECNICVHLFMCNCPNSLIQSTICKHMRLIQGVLKTVSLPTKQSPSHDDDSTDALDTEPTATPDNERSNYVEHELHSLAEHALKSEGPCDIATCKECV